MPAPSESAKSDLRRQLLAARRSLPEEKRDAEARSLSRHVTEFIAGQFNAGSTICAHVPVGSEPGSPAMLDDFAVRGFTVLLPVTGDAGPQPLHWSRYVPGELAKAGFGLLEPSGPRLPPAALADAVAVIIPALAVDRRGVRLGRGAGFYDRSLPLRRPSALLIAVVRDQELVDELPADPHDVAMTHVATPTAGVLAF